MPASTKRRLPAFLTTSPATRPSARRGRTSPPHSKSSSTTTSSPPSSSATIDLTSEDPVFPSPAATHSSTASSISPISHPVPALFPLLDLPVDLLVLVASHLSFHEVFQCRVVCRLFNGATNDRSPLFSFYTALQLQSSAFCDPIRTSTFSPSHPSQDAYITSYEDTHVVRITRLLNTLSFPAVSTVYLGRTAPFPPLLRLLAQRCGAIRCVHLTYDTADHNESTALSPLLDYLPHLTGVHVTSSAVYKLVRPLFSAHRLQELSLLTDGLQQPRVFPGGYNAWPQLRSLHLKHIVWPSYANCISSPELLTYLHVDQVQTYSGPPQLSDWLSRFSSLTHLGFTHTSALVSPSNTPQPQFDDYTRHKAEAKAAPRRKRKDRCPSSPTQVTSSPLSSSTPYRVYPSLLSLDVTDSVLVTTEFLEAVGAVCRSLSTLRVDDNGHLGLKAMQLLLSPLRFPSLTALYASRVRSTAFQAITDDQCPVNPKLRLLHLADAPSPASSASTAAESAAESGVTARHARGLSSHFPALTSLDLSHRRQLTPATLRLMLEGLPALRELRLLRMRLGTLDEVEALCLQFSRVLRDVHLSITGVVGVREAKRVMSGRMLRPGREGDVARREFSAEVQLRVWLRSYGRLTLHLDVEGVYGT